MANENNKEKTMTHETDNNKCEICLQGGLSDEPGIAAHRVTLDEHASGEFFDVPGKRFVCVCHDCLKAGTWEHEGLSDDGDYQMYADIVKEL